MIHSSLNLEFENFNCLEKAIAKKPTIHATDKLCFKTHSLTSSFVFSYDLRYRQRL